MGRQTFLPVEILDYIQTHERSEDEPFGISQTELAKSLGYHPCSMSRPLEELVRDGLVAASRGLVRGGRRKQLTYRLTTAGVARVNKETHAVPLLGRDIPPPPRPFLGRRAELASLDDAAQDPSGIVLIEGPPGMGKTALVSVHLRHAGRGKVLFWHTLRQSDSPRDLVSALAHALSLAGNPQLAYYAQLPRNPVAREVADLAARALGKHALVAVVDDLQLASPDIRQFLVGFVSGLKAHGGSHRFYLVGQKVDLDLGAETPMRRLQLGGLDRTAAHELTDRQGGLADRFEEIFQVSLGSPLLLKLAASNPQVATHPANLPVAVVRQLPIEDIRTILPAALANEPLPTSFLVEEAHSSVDRVQEMVRMGILHQRGEDRVELLEIVRNAVLGRMPTQEERNAHLALGRYYGRSHRPEAIRERFVHLVAGEDLPAATRLLAEQQQVILRSGYSDGLRRAFRHLSHGLPRGVARMRVLFAEAGLLRLHSEHAESIGILRRAIADSDPESPLAYEARFAMVEQMLRLGHLEDASAEFERAKSGAPTSRRLGAYAMLTEARIEEARGSSATAFEKYQLALNLARKARAQDLGLEAITAWSRIAEFTQAEVALKVIEDVLPQARQANRMDVVFNLLLVRSRAYSETGRHDLAEIEMKAILSEAESLGYLNQLAYIFSGLASVAVERSQWTDAATYARQAIATAERIGNDLVLGHTLAVVCSSNLRQATETHDLTLAREALEYGARSLEVLGRLPPSESLMLANSYLAEVCLLLGDLPSAQKYYAEAVLLGDRVDRPVIKRMIEAELGPKLAQTDARRVAASPGVGTQLTGK